MSVMRPNAFSLQNFLENTTSGSGLKTLKVELGRLFTENRIKDIFSYLLFLKVLGVWDGEKQNLWMVSILKSIWALIIWLPPFQNQGIQKKGKYSLPFWNSIWKKPGINQQLHKQLGIHKSCLYLFILAPSPTRPFLKVVGNPNHQI